MIAYPVVVAAISAVFAAIVGRQFLSRHRPHQLVWAIALTLGFIAAAAYVLFLAAGHDGSAFKVYYVCGGLLMAAYLGLGSIFLLAPRRVALGTAAVVLGLSLAGTALLAGASARPAALAQAAHVVGPGTAAIRPGPWKALVAVLNIFGAGAVIGGAAYSGFLAARRRAASRFFWANVLIAAGTILAGLAGGAADAGLFAGAFWVVLATGFVVLFAGFTLTLRRTGQAGSR